MATKELKSRIQKALDKVPQNILEDNLSYLEEIQGKPADKVIIAQRLRKILSEDKDLLEKLAH